MRAEQRGTIRSATFAFYIRPVHQHLILIMRTIQAVKLYIGLVSVRPVDVVGGSDVETCVQSQDIVRAVEDESFSASSVHPLLFSLYHHEENFVCSQV